jgi:aspartyl-tRNA synthetase
MSDQPKLNEAQAVADPTTATTDAVPAGDTPAGPSKSELKKRAKEAEKAKKAAERAAREEEERKAREAKESVDNARQNYGKLAMHQSAERNGEFRLGSEGERGMARERVGDGTGAVGGRVRWWGEGGG